MIEGTYDLPPLFIMDLKTAEENYKLISTVKYPVIVTMISLIQKRDKTKIEPQSQHLVYIRVPLRRSQLILSIQSVLNSTLNKHERKRVKNCRKNHKLNFLKSFEYLSNVEKKAKVGEIDPKNCTILVVEDNFVNQKIIVRMLANLGFKVDAANDGFQAIEAYKKSKYQLILMDVHMPNCNGLDATKAIREIEKDTGGHTPIIAVTASVADEMVCEQAGMDDFIPKPISKKNFEAKMQKWLTM